MDMYMNVCVGILTTPCRVGVNCGELHYRFADIKAKKQADGDAGGS